MPVPRFCAVTVALATTVLLASVTVPETLPPVPADDLPTNVSSETRTNRKKRAMRCEEHERRLCGVRASRAAINYLSKSLKFANERIDELESGNPGLIERGEGEVCCKRV